MGERLFGLETEYALAALDGRGQRVEQRHVLDALMRNARRRLKHLPDEQSHGLFLENGARFYIDCGGHPEVTTPECRSPWDVVRYVQAGEVILLRLVDERTAFYRGNVDYSGSRTTWGSHESYLHRLPAALLPKQLIPHFVSRLVYTGAGGFKNTSPGLEFTLSPRTAHIATEVSYDSTGARGIFHSKDEALCAGGYHRLHVICGESLCSELATWLRVGATALVVALCEADRRPGDAVALRNAVEAMRTFAADPTCTATVEMADGRRLTAIAIQRHYLEQAEACLGHDAMPPWAGEVCRRWRAALDDLEGGGAAAGTSLDWAIKRDLYRAQLARRGVRWESLSSWTWVMERLLAAWLRAKQPERALTADLVLGRGSPIAADVAALTSAVRRMGLDWGGLGAFLDARSVLFEIDTRFAQLGPRGIFSALDASGVLRHRVDGVGDIAAAVEEPPAVPRARVRSTLVRELTGNNGRYRCRWDGVWDAQERRHMDLGDPFAETAEWKASAEENPDVPDFLTGRCRWRLPVLMETRDPITLNQAALELRQLDQLEDAERLLRRAIEVEDAQVAPDSPKRPHRRNNLSVVLLRAEKFPDAIAMNAEAWRLKAGTGQHDVTSGRILFVRIALGFLTDTEVPFQLGQLKTLLAQGVLPCHGDIAATWDIPDVCDMLDGSLDPTHADFLGTLVDCLNDPAEVGLLEDFTFWTETPAIPLDTPWPG